MASLQSIIVYGLNTYANINLSFSSLDKCLQKILILTLENTFLTITIVTALDFTLKMLNKKYMFKSYVMQVMTAFKGVEYFCKQKKKKSIKVDILLYPRG